MVISRQMAKQKSNTGAFRSTLRQKLQSAASFDGLSIHLSTLKCSPLELKRGVRKEERGRGEQRSKKRDWPATGKGGWNALRCATCGYCMQFPSLLFIKLLVHLSSVEIKMAYISVPKKFITQELSGPRQTDRQTHTLHFSKAAASQPFDRRKTVCQHSLELQQMLTSTSIKTRIWSHCLKLVL